MKKIISICVFCTFSSAAILKEIRFNGLHSLSYSTALNIMDLKTGEEISEAKINTYFLLPVGAFVIPLPDCQRDAA